MKKAELVYLELLSAGGKKERLTQLGISKSLGVSLSTVNNALEPLRRMGAVAVKPRRIELIDKEKALLHWANYRNLFKDVVFETRLQTS